MEIQKAPIQLNTQLCTAPPKPSTPLLNYPNTHIYTCKHIYTDTHPHTHKNKCVHTHTHIHAYMHTYKLISAYAYMYTHIHTYTQTGT